MVSLASIVGGVINQHWCLQMCSCKELILLRLINHILVGLLDVRTGNGILGLTVTLIIGRLDISLRLIRVVAVTHLIVMLSYRRLLVPDLLRLLATEVLFQAS